MAFWKRGQTWRWANKEARTILIRGKHGPITNRYIELDEEYTGSNQRTLQAIAEAKAELQG